MQSALGRSPLNTGKQPSKGASLYSVSDRNSATWASITSKLLSQNSRVVTSTPATAVAPSTVSVVVALKNAL